MKKIYNKNAREKQLLEEAYGAIYERRNPDAGEWGGGLKGVFPGAEEGPNFDEEEEKQYDATNVQLMQILHNNIKRYGSEEEAIERLGIDPSLHKDLLRRYKKWAEREASFKDIKPASWFENEEEHDEYHPGYGKVEDSITVGDIIDQVELDLPLTPDIADALQNVMDTVRSSLKYSPEDEEKEDNENIDLTVDAGMSPQDRREAGER
jgi:hypothetical protein